MEVPHLPCAFTAALCHPRFSLNMEQTLLASLGCVVAHADSKSAKHPNTRARQYRKVDLCVFMVLV